MIAFEDVYPWLNKYEASHISPSSECLIDQVRQALSKGHADESRGLLQQLYDLACHLRDDKEVTEILIECAHSSFMLDDLTEAERILVDSVSRAWSDLHRRAVIQWMLGSVQWQSLTTRHQAEISWRNSLSDFERLSREAGLSSEQHAWYLETKGKLQESLLEALEQAGRYVDIDEAHSSEKRESGFSAKPGAVTETPMPSEPIVNEPSDTFRLSEPSVTHTFDILQLFTISEEIPAGDFGPSGIDPFPIGTVEIDHLTINNHPYSIHSTRGRKIINLPLDQKLSVVKVKGDSMDQENITEQDYVLLRRVDAPANGDIVMAEIVGIDSHATLKKYSREPDSITLRPHSSNPVHQPFVFKKVNEGFHIRGVVVAVLKPME
jgi:phage repressor protein C with HTH and peptisase S24 domain